MNTVKYPRTPHLPWSPGASCDDIRLAHSQRFCNQIVVVTEKMDGENTSLYPHTLHARSVDSRHHVSRDWVKQLQGRIGHLLPQGWRLCGENLYARHSIAYANLHSYFYLFSIWNEQNQCLSWQDTLEWAQLLGLSTVPVLYHGLWDEQKLRALRLDLQHQEGYVVRIADAFAYADFAQCVAKWVRKDHVQTDQHWMQQSVVANQLAAEVDNANMAR